MDQIWGYDSSDDNLGHDSSDAVSNLGLQGIASCSVAGLNHAPVEVDGHWNKSTSVAQAITIDDAVPPGEQAVECRMGPANLKSFRVIAVFTL